MYHNFFFPSSVSGHLGCFHDIAIANSAAMSIGVHWPFSILVSLGCMPRSGIAGSYMVVLFLVFKGISILQKQRHYLANKDLSSQGYGFSCGHVWMSELDCEEV